MTRWLTLIVPLLLTVGVILMLDRGDSPEEPELVALDKEQPRYSVEGARWVRLDSDGKPELRAKAATLDYYPDESVRMSDLTLDALGGLTSPWTMTASAGFVPPQERRVRLNGQVLAKGVYAEEPVQFRTDVLWVDLSRQELRTDSNVVLEGDYRRASAKGLRADFSGERVELLNNVQVEYVPES